uniref:Arrestin-like N-terminal domain-containing protein n=1 Tax=Bionectria ochroleuca TaxID=29856 RepID=A0A8H7TSR9_BIOOC
MPSTYAKSNHDLGVQVERSNYFPGDTVIGTIHRRNAMVCPEATVDVVLRGRTKSKMVVRRNNNSHTYRGRFTLLNSGQKVFQGPVHIPEGAGEPQQWGFAINIPTNIDARLFPQQYDAAESYIPIDPASVGQMPLPASFSSGYGRREAFIEYYIEATIRYQRKGSWHTETAVVPIPVAPLNPNPPVADFNLLGRRIQQSVSSQRLVPGMENVELSKKEKMKKFFGSSSVPRFAFSLELAAPRLLQIGNSPIPFSMRIVPFWSATTELIRDVPQKAKLVTFRATLETHCRIRCEGVFRPHEAYWDDELDLQSEGFGDRPLSVEIPCAIGDTPPVDVGGVIRLRLPATGVSPGFTTFNVRVSHTLSWKAKLEIAGESFTARAAQQVVVIPASSAGANEQVGLDGEMTQSWIVPPDEMAPPPSFAEAQREDAKQGASDKGASEIAGSSKADITAIEKRGNLNDAAASDGKL